MFCKNCGAKNNQDAKFCLNCGTSTELSTAIEHPEENKKTQEGNIAVENKMDVVENSVVVTETDRDLIERSAFLEEPSNKKKGSKRIFGIIAILCVLAVGGFFFLNEGGLAAKSYDPFVYMKGNGLMLRNLEEENSVAVINKIFFDEEILESGYGFSHEEYGYNEFQMVRISEDAKNLFFFKDVEYNNYMPEGKLYYRPVAEDKNKAKDGDEIGIRIASNVLYPVYKVSGDGSAVAYIKDAEDEGGKLFVYNMEAEIRISSDVNTSFYLSEDGQSILYGMEENGLMDYYIKPVDENSEREKVDSEIYRILLVEPNLQKVYYTKIDDDEDYTEAIYVKEKGKDKVKLVGDVNEVHHISENGNIVFTKSHEEKLSFKDLVTDDLANQDDAIWEPHLDDFIVGYDDYWYTSYPIYDYDTYYRKQDEYYEKQTRDNIRYELDENPLVIYKSDLYVYYDGKEEKVATDIYGIIKAKDDAKTIIYSINADDGFNKVKISELDTAYDAKDNYWSNSSDIKNIYLYNAGAEANRILQEKELVNAYITDDMKHIYFLEDYNYDKARGQLVKYSLNEKQEREVISDDVSQFSVFNGSNVLYGKDMEYGLGDIYLKVGDKREKIADQVRFYDVLIDENTNNIICLEDYNDDKLRGRLVSINGFDKTVIAEDIHAFYFRNSNSILYMNEYSSNRKSGEIWLYKGKDEKIKIDDDVTNVLIF